MKGDSSLSFNGLSIKIKNKREVLIKRIGGQNWSINGRLIKQESITVESDGKIWIRRLSYLTARPYQGKIELTSEGRKLLVINRIPVELYLEGVLNAEISTDWPLEAVKAQAVVARTYALYLKKRYLTRAWHLTADSTDQVYYGADLIDKRGLSALQQTRGIVVTHNHQLAQTFYHSNCGGMTESPQVVWGTPVPYLKVRSIPYGKSDPRYHWNLHLTDKSLRDLLRSVGIDMNRIKRVSIAEYSTSGRAYLLKFEGSAAVTLKASKFRKLVGYTKIQSLLFDVVRVPGGFYFKGRGNGHGVGLSQWSAKEMAEIGYKYQEILRFFYQGIKLERFDQLAINQPAFGR